ncbi:PREDICTED: olfactory receptor 5K1-like [Elephantulus edwardii]|uniref:olfactory receptor 5K1-like n=1 Tax=Elephantulus edwardii TaxID=28737 RepID=UPI0003F0EF59|nr:PREDICTED: olfactory receptor 5K1-like [Elephantulus edwardii]
MTKDNRSLTTGFILTGFMDHPDLKPLLFVLFFAIYLVTLVGNLGLIALITMERRLHTPMYFFLGNLALMDFCCSSAIIPKMLENFVSKTRILSLYECLAQFYFFCLAGTADCFLLAAMAYDRYVAICYPLQYHTMMSKQLCIKMTIGVYIGGNIQSMLQAGLILRLAFCGLHPVNHLYCDIVPLFRLSCVDPYINKLMLLIFSGLVQILTIIIVLISYLYILLTIFKMKSREGKGKALSTCASHFLSVSIFYGSLLFMYIFPHSGNQDIQTAVFYTVIIPLLNPFIYSLRNKEVMNIIKRIIKGYGIPGGQKEITVLIKDMLKARVLVSTNSLFKNPFWPVTKADSSWTLTLEYQSLKNVASPMASAVPDMLSLMQEMQQTKGDWNSVIDLANIFFSIPISKKSKARFSFTWEGSQFIFMVLPHG